MEECRYNSTLFDLGTTVIYLYYVRHSNHSAIIKLEHHSVEHFI
jgi:hypothetical protein